jgi:hypothetical protein
VNGSARTRKATADPIGDYLLSDRFDPTPIPVFERVGHPSPQLAGANGESHELQADFVELVGTIFGHPLLGARRKFAADVLWHLSEPE